MWVRIPPALHNVRIEAPPCLPAGLFVSPPHGAVKVQYNQAMNAQIDIPRAEIEAFCKRHHIRRLALFGSVLRDDFGPESDVDVLVEFEPEANVTLLDLIEIERELSKILRRPVDLTDYESVEEDPNYLRRQSILQSVETVYAAG